MTRLHWQMLCEGVHSQGSSGPYSSWTVSSRHYSVQQKNQAEIYPLPRMSSLDSILLCSSFYCNIVLIILLCSALWRSTALIALNFRRSEEAPSRICSVERKIMGTKGKEKFSLDIRKKNFIVKVVRYWNRFPRKTVVVLSLEVLRAGLDRAFSNVVYWEMHLRFILIFNILWSCDSCSLWCKQKYFLNVSWHGMISFKIWHSALKTQSPWIWPLWIHCAL